MGKSTMAPWLERNMGIPILWLNLRISRYISRVVKPYIPPFLSVFDVLSSADSRDIFFAHQACGPVDHVNHVCTLDSTRFHCTIHIYSLFISPRLWYHRQHPIKKKTMACHGNRGKPDETLRGPKPIHTDPSHLRRQVAEILAHAAFDQKSTPGRNTKDRRLDSDLASASQQPG